MRKKTDPVPSSISGTLDGLTEEMKEFGISYIGHGLVNVKGNHTGYFSNAKWQEIYMKNLFFHKEPILDAFVKEPLAPVHWTQIKENKVAFMRKDIIGVLSGVTFCSFHEDFFGFLNIGFSDERDTYSFVKKYQPLLNAYHQTFDRVHLAWRILA